MDRRLFIFAVLPVLGCGSDKATGRLAQDSVSAGTTGTTDTGTAFEAPGTTLTVAVADDIPRLVVNAHTVDFAFPPSTPIELTHAPIVDGEAVLTLEDPSESWLVDQPDGTKGVLVLPFAFVDDDENGVHTPEEQYVAAGTQGAFLVVGEPGPDLAAKGLVTGWNAVAVDLATGELSLHAPGLDSLTLAAQLIPVDRFVLEASWSESPAGLRVALVPETVLDGIETGPIPFDQPVSGSVQVPIDGPPPDSHLQDYGADGTQYRDWRYAVEHLIVYEDTDGSNTFGTTDTIVARACVDGVAAPLQHSTEPDRAFEALFLAGAQILPAWSMWLDLSTGPEYRRPDESGVVPLTRSCGT